MKIRYDKKLINISVVAAAVGVLSEVVMVLLFMMEKSGTELLAIFLLYEGVGVGIWGIANLVSGIGYFNRLKAYGYEVPYNRKDYDDKLENLPRVKEIEGKSLFSKHSIWSMYISIVAFCLFITLDALYFIKWNFVGDDVSVLTVLCGIFFLGWLIMALFFKKQSDPIKYRDDVEIDYNRKPRWGLGKAVVNMVVLGVISAIVISMAHSMTDYIFNARIASDREKAYEVCGAVLKSINQFETGIDDHNLNEKQIEDAQKTIEELRNGVDVAAWDEPYDIVQQAIADALATDDFVSLKNKFFMSESESQLWVEFKDNAITVELKYPKKNFVKYSKRGNTIVGEQEF